MCGNQETTTMSNNEDIKSIRDIIKSIIPTLKNESQSQENNGHFSYTQQRAMINQIFSTTSGENYNVSSIMLRLIVIDSLYSTNAAYSYFSFEEMAEKINNLGTEKNAAEYFYRLVNNADATDKKNLFSTNYGIRKNLTAGSKQMSLMSKYAYYVLLQNPDEYPLGFPIYDSLAIKMYPEVCKKFGISPQFKKGAADNNKLEIKEYISALNELRGAIFGNDKLYEDFQQYDLLDAYLWRMGKLDEGNYSLLFNKEDYKKFITNIGLSAIDVENYGEHIYNKTINENLVECKKKQDKNGGKVKYEYKYDFNDLVRYQCLNMKVEDILKDVKETNKDNMATMISHWKELYANLK